MPHDGAAAFAILDAPQSNDGATWPRSFSMRESGLWYKPPPRSNGTEPEVIWVCGPLSIVAETCDDTHHKHGLLLRWLDRTCHLHTWAMPRQLVHADGTTIASELEDAGLSCGTSRPAHDALRHFLGAVRVGRRVRCVERAGWHGANYVLPDGRVYGADADGIVLQTEHAATGEAYVERGTLTDWQHNVARYAIGNHLLVLTISAAFAAPLLDVTGEPSGGVHVHGASQTGKTTLLRSAASVYGPGDNAGLMRTWRATANGLEAVAAETSDNVLILDEMGQASAREVGDVVYMLSNAVGKARANRTGSSRRHRTWRTLFLSTGEVTLETKLSEAGLRPLAGQEVRMIGLPADAGTGMGVWQNLHDMPSAAALADHLRSAARTCCGTAGPTFLDILARDRADDPEMLTDTLRRMCEQFVAAHLPPDADGQVRSVSARFALIGAAGELGITYGVLPWPEDEALCAAGACFTRWLAARGGVGPAEDMRAVEAVRAFIAAHGASRFEQIDDDPPQDHFEIGQYEQRVTNRAGFRRRVGASWEYLFLASVWRDEVCRGLDPGRAARVLAEKELLVPAPDGRPAALVRVRGHGPIGVYRVRGTILGEDVQP
jgi:uncharacterized protein (DUF927 family)